MDSTQIVLPPYHYRWLNGYEYQDLLLNALNQNIPIFDSHPEDIYYQPKNGYLYILRSATLSNIGFPRLKDNSKKLFKWKKMNFQTLLPKHTPQVQYIVCSTEADIPHYRMHIVQLYSQHNKPGILLCHIRLINNNSISSLSNIQPHSYQTYEEIRNCKQRLSDCITKSLEVALEVEQIQLRLTLFDDDYNYLQQKFYTQEQRQEIMKLYSNLVKQNETFVNELRECEEVLQRYDSL